MFLDNLLLLSDAQAFTGAATVSTNVVDLGAPSPKREIGSGEPLVLGIATDVAAGAGSTTVIDIIQSTAAAMSSPDVLATFTDIAANITTGRLASINIPPGYPQKQFIAARVTITGGTTTATLTMWFGPASMMSLPAKAYAKNYVT